MNALPETESENVTPLAIIPKPRAKSKQLPEAFRIIPFVNKRTEGQSWRVTGFKRDRTRVRENFSDQTQAEARKLELQTEWITGHRETGLQATKLSEAQIRLAEMAFLRLEVEAELPLAVEYWIKHGRQQAVAVSPRIDEAVTKFKQWLETSELRQRTRHNLKLRVNMFGNSIGNLRVCDVTPEVIDGFMLKRAKVSASTRDNDRRAVSRFFSWCMERERKWIAVNPCGAVTVKQPEAQPPAVLSVDECRKLLRAAQTFKRGRLAPYVATCLFGGLRPFEAQRLQWSAVNLKDNEIRLEGNQTKTGMPRVVAMCKTLKAWLARYEGKPFYPSNWRKDFDQLKTAIGYGTPADDNELKAWPEDVLRHTAISHYFRKTGSYGETAEQFGNSEAIIKRHYQSRVSSDETKKFYALRPAKGRK